MKKVISLLALSFLFHHGNAQIYTGLQSMDPAAYQALPSNLPSVTKDKLPLLVDLSPTLPPVGSQSPQNSCVAWAIAYAAQSYYARSGFKDWNYITPNGQLNFAAVFSPSYVYNQINGGQDNGSNFYTALNLLKEQGVATMRSMPYTHFQQQPSEEARAEAARYKIKSFRRLGEIMDPVLDAKDQLAQSHPVIINAKTDLTYFDNGFSGNRPSPYVWSQVGNVRYGLNHALLVVGYNDQLQAFKFINSWGTTWGDHGYGWISYNNYNRVVVESFTMIPSFGEGRATNEVVYSEKQKIDQADVNNGFNFFLTNVAHMNTRSHPYVAPNDLYMTVNGSLSIPGGSGNTGQVVIYFYLIAPNGSKIPIKSVTPAMSLPNGNLITFTPPLPLNNNTINNLGWYAQIKYSAFNLRRGFNPPYSTTPITYNIMAEPALLIDNYPVRAGQPFYFPITF
jgi:hypothetical protein